MGLRRLLVRMLDPEGGADGQGIILAGGKFTVGDFPTGLTAEDVRDLIGSTLVAGSNVTITVNDAGDSVTIAATGGGAGGALVGAKVTRSAAYSLVSGAVTAFPFDAEAWDTDGFHDNTTNNTRLTVPSGKAGKYAISGGVSSNAAFAAGRFQVRLQVNGVTIPGARAEQGQGAGGTGVMAFSVAGEADLLAGDIVTLVYFQNSGASQAVDVSGCGLAMHKIG